MAARRYVQGINTITMNINLTIILLLLTVYVNCQQELRIKVLDKKDHSERNHSASLINESGEIIMELGGDSSYIIPNELKDLNKLLVIKVDSHSLVMRVDSFSIEIELRYNKEINSSYYQIQYFSIDCGYDYVCQNHSGYENEAMNHVIYYLNFKEGCGFPDSLKPCFMNEQKVW